MLRYLIACDILESIGGRQCAAGVEFGDVTFTTDATLRYDAPKRVAPFYALQVLAGDAEPYKRNVRSTWTNALPVLRSYLDADELRRLAAEFILSAFNVECMQAAELVEFIDEPSEVRSAMETATGRAARNAYFSR